MVISEYSINQYSEFPYQLTVYFHDHNEDIFLVPNHGLIVDSTGYKPGYYLADYLLDWCYDNFGCGSNGKFFKHIFFQGRGKSDVEINWWISWSYSHKHHCHFIHAHFQKEEDAMAFKLRWT